MISSLLYGDNFLIDFFYLIFKYNALLLCSVEGNPRFDRIIFFVHDFSCALERR